MSNAKPEAATEAAPAKGGKKKMLIIAIAAVVLLGGGGGGAWWFMGRGEHDETAEAAKAAGRILMPAMCVRFQPEWAWLKRAIADKRFGKLLGARFRRVAEPPGWGQQNFLDGKKSGGALLDIEGRLIGLNTAILSRSGGFNGVGFAIPINQVRTIAEQLVKTGRVDRAFLGVQTQPLEAELSAMFKVTQGALIVEVQPDTPAEKAGLKSGDIITKIDTTLIRDPRHLQLTVTRLIPGTEAKVEYLRDGKPATVKVKLTALPGQKRAGGDRNETPETKDIGVLNGVGVGDISAELREQLNLARRIEGAIITSVEADSPSARAGLREGDIILELDRRPVRNADEAVKLSEEIKGPKVLVRLWRNGSSRFLVVDESK